MSSARAAGALLVVGGLTIGGAGVYLRGHHAAAARSSDELKAAAAANHPRLEQALQAELAAIASRASSAAHLPEIAAALDLDADSHTFDDLLSTEDWWAPYRTEFIVNGVIAANGQLAILGPLDGKLARTAVVTQARGSGVGSGVAVLQSRAFLLAAARVPAGKRRRSGAAVILGAPLGRAPLQAIADATGMTVGLSDGHRLIAFAGPPASEPTLAAMVGHEEEAVLSLDDTRAVAAWPLDGGLSLLAVLPAVAPQEAAGLGGRWELMLALGGALVVAGAVLLARGPRSAAKSALDNPMAITQPFGSEPKPAPLMARDCPLDLRKPPAMASLAPLLSGPSSSPAGAPPVTAAERRPGAGESAAAAARTDAPAGNPVALGRYRLLERIGEGGMAEIFIAAAHGAEGFVRNFVVKRMHPHMARNREAVTQFIDEARLQSVLVHSNIVPVFDFGRAGDEYFLALEYIHGRDLENLVRRHMEVFGRPLSVPAAFYIMHEVLEALAYAHGRSDVDGKMLGIVHRDVAPGNVLVSMRGEVKLSDFGIAKSAARMSRTEVGMIKGNVSFMPPEQARGEPVDHRSDLFSAAVVLYHCLTAQFLYREGSLFSGLARAAIGPELSEFTQLGQIPPLAADVLRKGLSLDPAQRYQTAREFARDLAGHFTAGRSELSDLMETLFPELVREVR